MKEPCKKDSTTWIIYAWNVRQAVSGPENIISMFTKRKMVVLKTKIFL